MEDLQIPLQSTKNDLISSGAKKKIFIISKTQDSKSSKKKFACEKCSKLFSSLINLRNHILIIHENYRPFKCTFPNCTKQYENACRLIVHERTHTGIKPFVCQICQKSFNEKGNLKIHMRFHSEIRPFKCPLCGKKFKFNGHLKDHIKIIHYKIKKFCCKFCNKKFGKISTLKMHINTHTKEKKFQCKFEGCGKYFTVKGNMEKHYERHFKNLNKVIKNANRNFVPGKIQKDLEEKNKISLNQMDNKIKNFDQIKVVKLENENKTDVSSIEKKENLSKKNLCDNVEYNYINNLNNINNMNLGKFPNFSNYCPLIYNPRYINNNNLDNLSEKNEENRSKNVKVPNDNNYNNFNINNINTNNYWNYNFMGANYNNLNFFIYLTLLNTDLTNSVF